MKNPTILDTILKLSIFIVVGLIVAGYVLTGCSSKVVKPVEDPVETKYSEKIEKLNELQKKVDDVFVKKPIPVISIPTVIPTPIMGNYSVVEGDCLWTIAKKDSVYGDPWQWPLIWRANDFIQNPNLIEIVWNLQYPKNALSSEITKSIEDSRAYGEDK